MSCHKKKKIQISRRDELRLSPYTVLEAIGEC